MARPYSFFFVILVLCLVSMGSFAVAEFQSNTRAQKAQEEKHARLVSGRLQNSERLRLDEISQNCGDNATSDIINFVKNTDNVLLENVEWFCRERQESLKPTPNAETIIRQLRKETGHVQ
jgi:hypothetical protein